MMLSSLQQKLDYTFHDDRLLELAMTHRSYAFEHGTLHVDNQRLEFLGDAILDFVIAEELYRKYPNHQEGELSRLRSRLVCESALCILAKKLDFEHHILMGKGEVSASGMLRAGTLADTYEAVIGAIYLDGGMEPARIFILDNHRDLLNDPDGKWLEVDAKTRLQEVAQAHHLEPKYEVVAEKGPSHAPTFEVNVLLDHKVLGHGIGRNKKEAQQAAAKEALQHIEKLG